LSTKNPTWPDPGSTPGRRSGKPAMARSSFFCYYCEVVRLYLRMTRVSHCPIQVTKHICINRPWTTSCVHSVSQNKLTVNRSVDVYITLSTQYYDKVLNVDKAEVISPGMVAFLSLFLQTTQFYSSQSTLWEPQI
jgi:hypothetical protein